MPARRTARHLLADSCWPRKGKDVSLAESTPTALHALYSPNLPASAWVRPSSIRHMLELQRLRLRLRCTDLGGMASESLSSQLCMLQLHSPARLACKAPGPCRCFRPCPDVLKSATNSLMHFGVRGPACFPVAAWMWERGQMQAACVFAMPAMQTGARRQLVKLRQTANASFEVWNPPSRAFADTPAAVPCDQAMI